MSTRPEYDEVTNPANTVGKWSKGAPTSESFTKPIFINEGDAELHFTVPVMTPVANFGKTVPQIAVEGNSPPTVFFYLRPNGVDFYRRPDGTSRYLRP